MIGTGCDVAFTADPSCGPAVKLLDCAPLGRRAGMVARRSDAARGDPASASPEARLRLGFSETRRAGRATAGKFDAAQARRTNQPRAPIPRAGRQDEANPAP